jgi:beta-phosphoglucomutase-like phosphatase (HAD superfamily)
MISAVIFDVDGTLVDSNEFHVAAWERAFRHFGKEFPPEKLRQNIGKGSDQYLPEFLSRDGTRFQTQPTACCSLAIVRIDVALRS